MKNIRPALVLALSLLAAAPYEAAAQAVVAPVRAPAVVGNAGAAAMGLRAPAPAGLGVSALSAPTLSFSPSLTPAPALPQALVPAARAAAVALPASRAAVLAAPAALAAPVAEAGFVADLALIGNMSAPKAEDLAGARGTLESLGGSLASARANRGSLETSLDLSFDGGALRRAADAVPFGPASARAASLSRPGAAATAVTEPAAPQAPAPAKRSVPRTGLAAAIAVLAIAGALFAAPSFAIGAAGGVAAAAMSYAHPLGGVVGAAVGAAYGLVVARKADGSAPGTAELLSSIIRHALIAGAGTYIAFDLAAVYLMGMSPLAMSPLPVTLATAALAQGAFQGKFAEPATTPADRILGAFPAIAAALGLNIGVFFAAPTLLVTAAIGTMSATGLAAAIYAAVYQPGKSAGEGPAAMTRGFVLQSLMTGLALSMTSPYLVAPFLALAAWGFWDVISTTVSAVEARLPDPVRRLWRK